MELNNCVMVHYIFDIGELLPYVVTVVHAKEVPNCESLDQRIVKLLNFAFTQGLIDCLCTIIYVDQGEIHTINPNKEVK